MAIAEMSIPALLRNQATTQGDAVAYTFMDAAVLGSGPPGEPDVVPVASPGAGPRRGKKMRVSR